MSKNIKIKSSNTTTKAIMILTNLTYLRFSLRRPGPLSEADGCGVTGVLPIPANSEILSIKKEELFITKHFHNTNPDTR